MIHIGIDLGTTNSAIAKFDGEDVTFFKSPENTDVTPSAIYFDRRGNRFVGNRAYDMAARDPDNAALTFKRFMGTSTPINLPNLGRTLSPEECSAEILKALSGYLPMSLHENEDAGTVITVPAAFDQMQKDATLAAAQEAGIGRVALMQEPVAAVMSVMRKRRSDGYFLIYDIGGGTLDIAVAQSVGGRVSLLAHGGIAMCGGRDMDRVIVGNIIQPWLGENFDLSSMTATERKRLTRLSAYAAEKAKIELSLRDHSTAVLSEDDLRLHDAAGKDIYLDAPLDRTDFDPLIAEQIADSVAAARETLTQAGVGAQDVDRVVFVGGPTLYPPLRQRVARELGVQASTEVNPMTAVAEGAAIFAESVDWASAARGRKSDRGRLDTGQLSITFNYASRNPAERARASVETESEIPGGAEFQVDSLDTGWTSGRVPLRRGATVELPLTRLGDNTFIAKVFDAAGRPLTLRSDRIVITRTAATIDGIPLSHSIGIEVRERSGGALFLDYLGRAGDPLPLRGTKRYRSERKLAPGDSDGIRFKLWEGEINDLPSDNQYVGAMVIAGTDLDHLAIPAGADLVVDYQILDSGNIILEVAVPAIEGSFDSDKNFYVRGEGQIDFARAEAQILGEAEALTRRLDELKELAPAAELEPVHRAVEDAETRARTGDTEDAKLGMELLRKVKHQLAELRLRHQRGFREAELERAILFFDDGVRDLASAAEIDAFSKTANAAEGAIASQGGRFEGLMEVLWGHIWRILWRSDDFIYGRLHYLANRAYQFRDPSKYARLIKQGRDAAEHGDADGVRQVLFELEDIRIIRGDPTEMAMATNILRGS